MPNGLTALSNASTAFCGAGFRTMLNRPDAPAKSRFQIAAMGVQVLRGQVQHGGTVENRRIDKALPGSAVAACRDPSGFGFCGLDVPSFEKLMRSGHQRRFAAAATNREQTAGRRGRRRDY